MCAGNERNTRGILEPGMIGSIDAGDIHQEIVNPCLLYLNGSIVEVYPNVYPEVSPEVYLEVLD